MYGEYCRTLYDVLKRGGSPSLLYLTIFFFLGVLVTNHEIYIKLLQLRLKMEEFFDHEDWAMYEEMEKEVDSLISELNPSMQS